MRLEPLYVLRFFYPDGWQIDLTGKKGTEEDHFYFAEGNCEGRISGRFRGSNHPHRRTDETFEMNIQGFIETNDSALIMLDYQGYGRSFDRSQQMYSQIPGSIPATKSRRQIVGFARHTTGSEKYMWLNDAVCAIAGEVRAPPEIPPEKRKQADVKLVLSVSEMKWEAPPE